MENQQPAPTGATSRKEKKEQAQNNAPIPNQSAATTPPPPTNTNLPVQEVEAKQGPMDAIKKNGFLIMFLVLGILATVSVVLYFFGGPEPPEQPQEPTIIVEEPEPEEPQNVPQEYTNRQFEFSFLYPGRAAFYENNPFSTDPSIFQVAFSDTGTVDTEITNTDLESGYFFKVIVNKGATNQVLEDVVDQKKLLFRARCPEEAQISNNQKLEIGRFPALQFNVDKCEGNYVITFSKRGSYMIELQQFYKGDLGYIEPNRAATNEIFNSFAFINVVNPIPVEEWTQYENTTYKFKFLHPQLDSNCCNINGPLGLGDNTQQTATKLIALADTDTVSETAEDKPFNGLALYVVKNVSEGQFASYLSQQQQALVENYKVIIGKVPNTSEQNVLVGNREGILLRNYAWWGDIIFVPLPETNSLLAIAKTEVAPGDFEIDFQEILSTFEFEDTPQEQDQIQQ